MRATVSIWRWRRIWSTLQVEAASCSGILLGTESSMRNEGVLKAAVHGIEAAQRFREGERTRELITRLERSVSNDYRFENQTRGPILAPLLP